MNPKYPPYNPLPKIREGKGVGKYFASLGTDYFKFDRQCSV